MVGADAVVTTGSTDITIRAREYKLSMMNSKIVSPSDYTPLRNAYITELFNVHSTNLETILAND